MIMTIDEKKLFYDVVSTFEGFRPRPYRCPAGVLTIGYGHTKGVTLSCKVNEDDARILLISDFDKILDFLKTVQFSLEEHEYYALADFVFNLGIGKFTRSSLFRLINQYCRSNSNSSSEYYRQLICDKIEQFVYYTDCHGKKHKSSGLAKRRKFESILFKYGEVKSFDEL